MEESNIQPVQSPVTVCGDIHGNTFKWINIVTSFLISPSIT